MKLGEFCDACPASAALFSSRGTMSTFIHRYFNLRPGQGYGTSHRPHEWRYIVGLRVVNQALSRLTEGDTGLGPMCRAQIATQVREGMPDTLMIWTGSPVIELNVPVDDEIRFELSHLEIVMQVGAPS